MNDEQRGWRLGSHIAPPRFILFCVVFAAGLFLAIPPFGLGRGTLVAFDAASGLFLLSIIPLMRGADAKSMREQAKANDANRVGLLALTGLVMVIILVAVAGELSGKPSKIEIALVVATLAFAWLFSNTVYALHYAHLFYLGDKQGKDCGGLDFPECDEPDYWDFVYFAFTLGMTFQTSDVEMTARTMRRVTIGHCLAAFVFNIGVLAFTINVLGGS
ncbi:DUF1345 domain-containing protein [Sphingomonas koreensis]|nr:DUF1345 domain-containing protein [Sphingomonas koreensis]